MFNTSNLINKLESFDINQLAKDTLFTIRKSKKIDPITFLVSFFMMMISGKFSLRLWAININSITNKVVSLQAVARKLQFRHVNFISALLQKAFISSFNANHKISAQDILSSFNRVILEDSSCFKLPNGLYEFFPGSNSPGGDRAIARAQFRMDIKSNSYSSMSLTSYCKNDQSHAEDIVDFIDEGDLIIRDLGYWNIKVLKAIIDLKAFFVSRIKVNTKIYNVDSTNDIDLYKYLKNKENNGITCIDKHVLIGRELKMKVRLVAFKLNPTNAAKRRRQTVKNRSYKGKISEKTMYLQSWNIFITNVDENVWDTQQVYTCYSLRWHIEMTFKLWKSKFNLNEFVQTCTGRNPARPEILIQLFLTWILLFYVSSFNFYMKIIAKKFKRYLSPLKFADYLKQNFSEIIMKSLDNLDILLKYHCYEKRKDRENHFEKTYMFSLS